MQEKKSGGDVNTDVNTDQGLGTADPLRRRAARCSGRVALWAALTFAGTQVAAAPHSDWLLERHRSLVGGSSVTPPASLQLAPADDGLLLWGGTRHVPPMPLIVQGEVGYGVKLTRTLLGQADGLRIRVGASLHEVRARTGLPSATLEGSELSIPFAAGRLYASQERRHWGPGWVGSLVLDGGAPAIAAVGWRKADDRPFETSWLRWLGRWNADVFFGGLADHREPERPWLVGMRLTLEPIEGLQLGLSRVLQWGGRGFDQSPRSLLRSLLGKDPNSDVDGGEQGNQMAGVDLRYGWRWGPAGSAAVYGQAIGEDEAGELPYKFLLLAGGEIGGRFSGATLPALKGASWRVFAEWADTGMQHAYGTHQPGAYRHHVYKQGYVHHKQVLGHQIGGDAELVSVGGLVDDGKTSAMLVLHAGRALSGAQKFRPGDKLRAVSVGLQTPAGFARGGLTLNVVQYDSRRDHHAQAWMAWDW